MAYEMTKRETMREFLGEQVIVHGLSKKVEGEFMYGHVDKKGNFFESFPGRDNRRINERLGYHVIKNDKKLLQIPLKAIVSNKTLLYNHEIFVDLEKYQTTGIEIHLLEGMW